MIIVIILMFAAFAWLALLSAEESRDFPMFIGIAGMFLTLFISHLIYI